MIIRIGLIFLFVISAVSYAQKLLPFAINGKWGLIFENGSVALQPMADYIEFQESGQRFVYEIQGKYGVMGVDGKILTEPKHDQIYFYNVHAAVLKTENKWRFNYDFSDVLNLDIDTSDLLNDKILFLTKKDSNLIYNLQTNVFSKAWYVDAGVDKNLIIADKKNGFSDVLYLDNLNVLVEDIQEYHHINKDIMYFNFKDGFQFYNISNGNPISEKYESVEHGFDSWFICTSNNKYFLYNCLSTKSYEIPRVEEILEISGNLVSFSSKGKIGVINFYSGQIILEANYDGIALHDENIFIQQDDFVGLASRSGKIIIEPLYSEIENYGSVYVVEKDNRKGILNLQGKEVEPCSFSKIDVFEKNIKCYKGKQLTTINIDNKGNVVDRTVYDEYMSVSFEKKRMPAQRSTTMSFNGTNLSRMNFSNAEGFGWFQNVYQRTDNGVVRNIYGSWGMKNENDSIVIRPRFKEIFILPYSNYTLAFQEKRVIQIIGKKAELALIKAGLYYAIDESVGFSDGYFYLVNHKQKYILGKEKFKAARADDFSRYTFARALLKTPVLIDSFGNVVIDNITYFDDYTEGHLRVCIGGVQTPYKRFVPGFSMSIQSFFSTMGLQFSNIDPKKPYYFVKGGKWHFVNRRGEIINEKPFDYIYPFVNNRSIVNRKGKWGVIDTNMNEIVPIVNQSVDRIYIKGQSYFRVKNPSNQRYFYNRAEGSFDTTSYAVFMPLSRDLIFVQHPKQLKWAIADTLLNFKTDFDIEEILGRYGEFQTVKKNGVAVMLNLKGEEIIGGFDAQRIVPLEFGRYRIEKSNSDFYIIDNQKNILIPRFSCYKILSFTQDYIFYKDYKNNCMFWSSKSISLPKKTILLGGNPKNELLLLLKGKRKVIYDIKSGLITKKINQEIISLENGGCIIKKENKKVGMISYSGDTLLQPVYSDIKFSDFGWGALFESWNQIYFINEKGEKIYPDVFSEMKEVEDVYFIKSNNKFGVIDKKATFILPCEFASIEVINNTFYLAKKDGSSFIYTKSGELVSEISNSYFAGIPPNGLLVKKGKVFYFSSAYINPILSFREIIPISGETFVVQESQRSGVYSYEGDTLIVPNYHEIKVDRDFFQVKFFNNYGYFNSTGEEIFDPYVKRN